MNTSIMRFTGCFPLTVLAMSLTSTTLIASDDTTGEYASKSHAQAIVPMTFRDGTSHLRKLDNVNGVAISEGDIIFGDAATYFNNARRQSNFQRYTRGLSNYVYGTVWPNGVVPYTISDQLSGSAAAKVRTAIEAWNETGAITLVERTASTAAAYPNYVDFIDADQCASWVGFQNDGAQSIYTGDRCSEGSMIHEIGHALGLLHEHTRPDRDNFVQVNWNSIDTEKSHNFDVLSDAIPLGEYDYESIMHYGTHFFSNDGQPTISALQNTGATIGQRKYISAGDEASMRELYQSELALVSTAAESVTLGGSLQLNMHVTNNTDMGANSLSIATQVPEGAELVSFSSPSWTCQQSGAGAAVVCQSQVLAKNGSSSVALNLSSSSDPGIISFDATLSSNTFDTDLSNNSDSTSSTVLEAGEVAPEPPVIAAAPVAAPAAEAEVPVFAAAKSAPEGGSSGGGSFGILGIALVLMRRRLR